MTASRVLLVDDVMANSAFLHTVFDERLVWAPTVAKAKHHMLMLGDQISTVFVDFQMMEPDSNGALRPGRSGLSVLALARKELPRARLVCYSSLDDRSRYLFAAAATRWFGASTILGKSTATPDQLKAAADGANPTQPRIREMMRHSDLIDPLFNTTLKVDRWVSWASSANIKNTSEPNVYPWAGKKLKPLTDFTQDMRAHVENFGRHIGTKRYDPTEQGSDANLLQVGEFVAESSDLFLAPDFREIANTFSHRR